VPQTILASAMVPRRRWTIALLLGVGVLVNYFDRVNLSVCQNALQADFGISIVTFGYLSSAYNWTYASLQMPVGVLLDRFGVRKIGRVSTLLWSAASFATAASTWIVGFFAARFLLGVGEAPTFPANSKAIGYWFPQKERSLATALFDSAAKFSPGLGVPLAGLLLLRFGWRGSFAAAGFISFLYFVLFYWLYRNPSEDRRLSETERKFISDGGAQPEDPAKAARTNSWDSFLHLLLQPKVLGLVMGFSAYNYSFYLLLTWLPGYFSTTMHLDLKHSVYYTSVPWLLAGVADLAIGGWLVDWLIRRGFPAARIRRIFLIGGTCFGLGILGAARAQTLTAALFWLSLCACGLAVASPVVWSIPSLIAPRESVGTLGGIMNFGGQVSAIAAPVITAYIVAATHSFAGAFVAAAVILLIGICGYGFLLGRIEPIPDPA
jgi:ACS family D-galactonate transporter-like MFS transporter